jgi:hypothetical protein
MRHRAWLEFQVSSLLAVTIQCQVPWPRGCRVWTPSYGHFPPLANWLSRQQPAAESVLTTCTQSKRRVSHCHTDNLTFPRKQTDCHTRLSLTPLLVHNNTMPVTPAIPPRCWSSLAQGHLACLAVQPPSSHSSTVTRCATVARQRPGNLTCCQSLCTQGGGYSTGIELLPVDKEQAMSFQMHVTVLD